MPGRARGRDRRVRRAAPRGVAAGPGRVATRSWSWSRRRSTCASIGSRARGVARADAQRRIAAQATDEERRALATHVVDNSGDLAHLEAQVDELWADLERIKAERVGRRQRASARSSTRPAGRAHRADVTPLGHNEAMPKFELVSEFSPAGDQPAAIAALVAGHRGGGALPDAARDHRLGEVVHDRRGDRGGAAADDRAGAEQEPRCPARERVPRALPEEPGRVLRLVLRLLPTRGVPALDRHVHREGLVDQRRDRPAPPLGHQRDHESVAT